MEKYWWLVSLFFLVVVGLLLSAAVLTKTCCAQGIKLTGGEKVQLITASELNDVLKTGRQEVFLLDVRTPEEYSAGHINQPDELIDYREIEGQTSRLPEDKNQLIVVYCRTGHRSAQAATTLAKLGYTNIRDLSGGIEAWQNQGFLIEKGDR